MNLTKDQSFELYLAQDVEFYVSNYVRYSSKTPAQCLACGKQILVSYYQYGRNSIFCDDCRKSEYSKPTMAQAQYVRRIKEQQLREMTKIISSINI